MARVGNLFSHGAEGTRSLHATCHFSVGLRVSKFKIRVCEKRHTLGTCYLCDLSKYGAHVAFTQ